MKLSVDVMNLIAIYKAKTRTEQMEKLWAARSHYSDEPELFALLESAAHLVETMTNDEFMAISFELATPVGYCEDVTEDFTHSN